MELQIATLEEAKYFMQKDRNEIEELRMSCLKKGENFYKAAKLLKLLWAVALTSALENESQVKQDVITILKEAGLYEA